MESRFWTTLAITLGAVTGGSALAPGVAARVEKTKRPNILFIMTDDQAPWAVGAANNPDARTPNMDRLFREGAYLTNCFTPTPVCSPSRATLMTSRYGSELGITDWINPRREPEHGLDPATVTWPELLAEGGYSTGLVGKWHLGDQDRHHPTRTGFQYFMGFRGGGTSPRNPSLEVEGEVRKLEGYTYDLLTDHALGFLDRSAENARDGKPFLLSVHYRAPHAPWLPAPEEDWAPFKDADPRIPHPDYPKLDLPRVKRVMREYLASVAGVDRNLGRILKRLDDLRVADNTLVVFTSDHGYNMGHNGVWHKGNGHWILTDPPAGTANVPRGQRPNMYDHSIRVPTAVRWPGVVKPGTRITRTVSHLDWYPTLTEAAGVRIPAGTKIRGRSILPLLKGRRPGKWSNDFYAEYSTHHQTRTHMRMYRTERWKLVRDFLNEGRDELYDLKQDPEERTNRIADPRPEVRRAISDLHARILARMREVGDPVLKTLPE